MKEWLQCKNILLVRWDSVGEIIMSNPAFIQVRLNLPQCKLTLLTSSDTSRIIPYLGTIDDTIIFDSPWTHTQEMKEGNHQIKKLIHEVKKRQFDGCIIFSSYSQNMLPTALLLYMADIPLRAAFCREDPHNLLTHWIVDPEPLTRISHQIKRDLYLLEKIGFKHRKHNHPYLLSPHIKDSDVFLIELRNKYILLNLDITEKQKQIPVGTVQKLIDKLMQKEQQVVLIGKDQHTYFHQLLRRIHNLPITNLIGKTNLEEILLLTKYANLLITMNTDIAHMACAYKTPVLVLTDEANPPHMPWSENSSYLMYKVKNKPTYKNEIVQYVHRNYDSNLQVLNMDKIFNHVENFISNISDS